MTYKLIPSSETYETDDPEYPLACIDPETGKEYRWHKDDIVIVMHPNTWKAITQDWSMSE